jgi:tetratricopeptide (TPR) repeat protein
MIIFPSSECAKSISGWQLRCGVDRRREGLDIRPYRRAEMDTSGILKRFFLIGRLLLLLPLVGCAASQATQEIQQGRRALLTGSPAIAVQHFERAAALDGKNAGSPLGEITWTYIGRAYYGAIKYSLACQALDRALAQNQDDDVARVYIGLIGARERPNEADRNHLHPDYKDSTIVSTLSQLGVSSNRVAERLTA